MRYCCHSVAGAALLVTLLGATPVAAQMDNGFLRGKGKTDAAFSYSEDTYRNFWMGNTRVHDPGVRRITRTGYNVYAAHGLSEDVDLSASTSYVHVDSTGAIRSEDDITDLNLRLKWRCLRARMRAGEFSLLAAPGIKFPLKDYEENAVTAIGDGQEDYRARAIFHYQSNDGVFASLDTGYDFRASRPRDEFPVHVTVGFTVIQRLTLSAYYSHVNSLGGYDIGQGPFPGVEEDYERWGFGGYWRGNGGVGISANYFETLDGKNTGDVYGFGVGLVFSF